MKFKILLLLSLCASLSFAQLTVRNASYVYAQDVVVFVKDDINIRESTANIYLRDESQLIQGSGTTGNSGIGKLSVHQNGTSNTYMYNYWCSPVGNTIADNTTNRTFIANNNLHDPIGHVDPELNKTYCLISNFTTGYDGVATVPYTTAQTISKYWLYTFDPGTIYSEWDYIGDAGNVTSGYGFTMKGNSSGAQKYDFRGKPNSGNILTSVLNNQETLIGNPYPSALDAYYFIHEGQNQTNTTGVLKYWEQQAGATSHVLSNYVGGYALYTNAATSDNGTPTDLTDDTVVDSFTYAPFQMYLLDGTVAAGPPVATGVKVAKRYIPVGQGFMIQGTANGNVITKNAHRVFYKQSGINSYFFKGAQDARNSAEVMDVTEYTEEGLNIVPSDFKRFRINVGFDNNGNDSYTRQLLMNFHHTATDGFDYGLEAQLSEQVSSDANWTLDGTPYAIQAFDYDIALRMPLIVNVENQQLTRFGIYDVQNFDTEQPIYIHDMENDLYVNLQDQAYEISLEAGNYTDRFEIVFQSESLSTEEFTDTDFLVMQNNTISQLTILNPNQQEVKSVALFDVSGKRIFNEIDLSNQNRYEFSTKNLSEGVYVVKVTFANQTSISKKVVVSHKK